MVGADELLLDLGFVDAARPGPRSARPLDRRAALALLDGTERAVAASLAGGAASADAIAARTSLTAQEVASAITLLMLRGWVAASGAAYLPAGPLLI